MAKEKNTRERLLDAAERHFAERGFHGASLRDVGREMKMANASLLYHFPSKRRMYAAVLERIAVSLMAVADELDAATESCDHDTRLRQLCDRMLDWSTTYPGHVRIIVRELVDSAHLEVSERNVARWYLGPAVERLAKHIPRRRAPERQVVLMHLVGSLSYFAVGLPTIAPMLGREAAALQRVHRRELRRQFAQLAVST
jgi:AcrR family transcriptional regulator